MMVKRFEIIITIYIIITLIYINSRSFTYKFLQFFQLLLQLYLHRGAAFLLLACKLILLYITICIFNAVLVYLIISTGVSRLILYLVNPLNQGLKALLSGGIVAFVGNSSSSLGTQVLWHQAIAIWTVVLIVRYRTTIYHLHFVSLRRF